MDLVQGVTANETTVIVFTNPDCATLIASLLDHNKQELSILATAAGSDTIIIIPDSIKNVDRSRQAVSDFLLCLILFNHLLPAKLLIRIGCF